MKPPYDFGKVAFMKEAVRFRELATRHGISTTAGTLAAASWLAARGLASKAITRWDATVLLAPGDAAPAFELDERIDTRFRIEIYSEEWGFLFCHGGRASWIRVTDIPFVHVRDDFRLLAHTPPLRDLGLLLRRLERDHGLRFRREHALVRTNLADSERQLRAWIETL